MEYVITGVIGSMIGATVGVTVMALFITAKCSQYIKDTKVKPEKCIWDILK